MTELGQRLAQLHWSQGHWLWLAALLLLSLWLLLRLRGVRLNDLAAIPFHLGSIVYRHSLPALLAQMQSSGTAQRPRRQGLLRGAGLVLVILLLALSLAGPYLDGKRLPEPVPYREVVFIIDTSISMSLRDYLVEGQRVDRMTMLKNVMQYFINQLRGNRISVIVFSEEAYTLVPLSNDYPLLNRQLQRLQPAMLTGRTTDVSKGLLYALDSLQQSGMAAEARKPALVLVSDVKRPSRDISPLKVAEYIHAEGYTLHSIAIGAGDLSAAEEAGLGLIYQPANFPLLADIADAGGGRFFIANSTDSLKQAVLNIQEAEQRQVAREPRYVAIPYYHWPLLALLSLIMGLQLWRALRR